MDKTTLIEINGTAYRESEIDAKAKEYALFKDGEEIARTCSQYAVIFSRDIDEIKDAAKWAESFLITKLVDWASWATLIV